MADQTVRTTPQNTFFTPVFTAVGQNPALTGVYVFSAASQTGVAGANTYLSLFNPAASGKTLLFGGAFVSMVATGATAAAAPMRGFRITTAPTGGTVQAAAAVAKFSNTYPNPAAEVRVGPAIATTLAAALWNTPPAVTNGVGGGQFIHFVQIPPGVGPFSLAPGEGIAINCSNGDPNQSWNMSVAWAEM